MGLNLDPREPVEHAIGSRVYLVRVFTARDRMRFAAEHEQLRVATADAPEDGGVVSVALTPELVDAMEGVLHLGVIGWAEEGEPKVTLPKDRNGYATRTAIGAIPEEHWGDLYHAILAENFVSEDESKNSL